MPAARPSRGTRCSRIGALALALAAGAAITTAVPPSAHADASSTHTAASSPSTSHNAHSDAASAHAAAVHHATQVKKVIHEAREQAGKPYVYGADGPGAFDCSGLVRYVFQESVHVSLPHNAAAQYQSVMHISHANLKVGDLIFTDNGGYISHVGIYAGGDRWWVAPRTGTNVQKQRIYHAHFKYGRVLRYTHA